jgi:TonB family protein
LFRPIPLFGLLVAAFLTLATPLGHAQQGSWESTISSGRRALEGRDFEQAESQLQQALAQARGFSENDPRRVQSLMELAKLHRARGDYARPETLYREADPIAQQAWGTESAEYASMLNEIGRYYHVRRKYDLAERFYKQGFGIRTRVLGKEHADVAASINNLAVLYENQAQYPKSEMYYQTALGIREKTLGPDHADTILSLEHFSRMLHKLSRPDEAEAFTQRARAHREALFAQRENVDLGEFPTGVATAELLERTEPGYTDEARIARQEGMVLLDVEIDAEGRARNFRVARQLGLGLDEMAIEAVKQWKFRPARSRGRRVPSRARLEITFRLM